MIRQGCVWIGWLWVGMTVWSDTCTAQFEIRKQTDAWEIVYQGEPVATYVFRDPAILRPYFAQIRTPGGTQVSRNHPPLPGIDPEDHATMHPGVWFGLGDVNENDFWRNKATVRHLAFVETTSASAADSPGAMAAWSTQNILLASDGEEIGNADFHFEFHPQPKGWLLSWQVQLTPGTKGLILGDQEEMGFGVRVATPITETRGGRIVNSHGDVGAKATWGKAALWSDYSGVIEGERIGVFMRPHSDTLHPFWFHNRDYGLMVANPFGRNAFTGGEKSHVVIAPGQTLQLSCLFLIYAIAPDAQMDGPVAGKPLHVE